MEAEKEHVSFTTNNGIKQPIRIIDLRKPKSAGGVYFIMQIGTRSTH